MAQDVTDPGTKLQRWWPIIVALLLGAVAVGRSEIEVAYTKERVSRLEAAAASYARQEEVDRLDRGIATQVRTGNELDREMRNAIGKLQLNIARICVKVGADCRE